MLQTNSFKTFKTSCQDGTLSGKASGGQRSRPVSLSGEDVRNPVRFLTDIRLFLRKLHRRKTSRTKASPDFFPMGLFIRKPAF